MKWEGCSVLLSSSCGRMIGENKCFRSDLQMMYLRVPKISCKISTITLNNVTYFVSHSVLERLCFKCVAVRSRLWEELPFYAINWYIGANISEKHSVSFLSIDHSSEDYFLGIFMIPCVRTSYLHRPVPPIVFSNAPFCAFFRRCS
jgi:hypothetical protein